MNLVKPDFDDCLGAFDALSLFAVVDNPSADPSEPSSLTVTFHRSADTSADQGEVDLASAPDVDDEESSS